MTNKEPKIIFEDEEIVVIGKPAGIVVNEAETVREKTVQKWFTERFKIHDSGIKDEFTQKGGVVHRLDKDTSGVMVLAKTPEAYEKLKAQFLTRQILKKYIALVHGKVKEERGEISLPVERHPKDRKKFTVGGDLSRTAITEFRIIKIYGCFTLLELIPHTGRTHQLRVHMQYLHHPMVSDPIYGFAKTWMDDLKWCGRLFLHANWLEFEHPRTGKRVSFGAELPEELQQALGRLTVE